MNLIIVESPTKAKTLSRFLGKDYSVIATTGHIKDLPKSKLSVDVEHDFKPDYVLVEKRAKTISEIKSEAQKAKNIFVCIFLLQLFCLKISISIQSPYISSKCWRIIMQHIA